MFAWRDALQHRASTPHNDGEADRNVPPAQGDSMNGQGKEGVPNSVIRCHFFQHFTPASALQSNACSSGMNHNRFGLDHASAQLSPSMSIALN